MKLPTQLSQWRWPSWLEDLAALAPDPDGLARLCAPDPLDWAVHGLASDFHHGFGACLTRAFGGLEDQPEFEGGRYHPAAPPAWRLEDLWDPAASPQLASASSAQRLEVALLVAIRRGANPWDWKDTSPGAASPKAARLLGELFANRLFVAARAMLSHPSCPKRAHLRVHLLQSCAIKVRPAGQSGASMALPLAKALAVANDLEGMGVVLDQGLSLRLKDNEVLPVLAMAQSREMVRLILDSSDQRAREVFRALLGWMLRSDPSPARPFCLPDSVRTDMIEEAGRWWQAKELGDARQWEAQVACAFALAHPPTNQPFADASGDLGAWIRQVGKHDGSIWLPSPLGPGPLSVRQCMRAVPAQVVRAWLIDRTEGAERWHSDPDTSPWLAPDRLERLENWSNLEAGLSTQGNMERWEKAWGRAWSGAPPLPEWGETQARTAARLWALERRPKYWPPKEWDLDEWGPEVLARLPAPVRQIVGEAFVLSITDGFRVRQGMPHPLPGAPQQEWWGPRVKDRLRWLEAWLQTPGWRAPDLTDDRKKVLAAWPVPKGEAGVRRLVSLWRSHHMEEALPPPAPVPRPSRL